MSLAEFCLLELPIENLEAEPDPDQPPNKGGTPAESQADLDLTKARLTACAALARVAEVAIKRTIRHAAAAGMTQQEIAGYSDVSQATVSRLLATAGLRAPARPTVGEIIDLHVAELIDDRLVVRALLACDITFGRTASTGEGEWISGNWDTIRRAYLRGLISAAVFEHVATEVQARYPGESVW